MSARRGPRGVTSLAHRAVRRISVPIAVLLGAQLFVSSPARATRAAAAAAEEASPPKRTWIKHEVIAGDLVSTVARRYGVTKKEIIRWNKLNAERPIIVTGRKLRVYARVVPLPRERHVHVVQPGDSWYGIAREYDVSKDLVRRWNPRRKRLVAGQTLVIWREGRPPPPPKASTEALPLEPVVYGGVSIGKPSRGRIHRSVQIPLNEALYTLLRPSLSYGSTHAVEQLQLALARFRRDYPYEGKLVISSMSKEGGGPLSPHRSHQSGRDVDIRLPLLLGLPGSLPRSYDDVDWNATWAMVRALIDTGEVTYIFLNRGGQARLHRAARRAGVKEEELRRLIQYPSKEGRGRAVVRHSPGHDKHLHVRFKCAETELECAEAG